MRLWRRCAGAAALFLAVTLAGCLEPEPQRISLTPTPTAGGTRYTVRQGENLYSIASKFKVDWRALVEANPSLQSLAELQPGQIIIIPGEAGESGTARSPGHGGPIPAEAEFAWPLRGEIVARFEPGGSGVDIRARAGQTVVAAKSGRVNVFEKTPEYGKVIVLEHEDGSATYYGRLGEILVTHGAWVRQGETIATLGRSGGATGAELQFRVMQNEQFVDPLGVLPR